MAAAGTLFSYLAAFVTIVLALGLTDLLTSLHRLLRHAAIVRWAALPLAAALFILLALFSEFFTIWQLTLVERGQLRRAVRPSAADLLHLPRGERRAAG